MFIKFNIWNCPENAEHKNRVGTESLKKRITKQTPAQPPSLSIIHPDMVSTVAILVECDDDRELRVDCVTNNAYTQEIITTTSLLMAFWHNAKN
ncbi:17400_t:CDS:2 [Acaulospora morrowiae]|uniref:17400_t:CDS:1 n=1 Tax=Acaulospora morrowiae TaxID=94023 RepID=A0A9N8VAK5_9GLOM|nr:17400_t:CDS:2 [Acaulospora morrowiae]